MTANKDQWRNNMCASIVNGLDILVARQPTAPPRPTCTEPAVAHASAPRTVDSFGGRIVLSDSQGVIGEVIADEGDALLDVAQATVAVLDGSLPWPDTWHASPPEYGRLDNPAHVPPNVECITVDQLHSVRLEVAMVDKPGNSDITSALVNAWNDGVDAFAHAARPHFVERPDPQSPTGWELPEPSDQAKPVAWVETLSGSLAKVRELAAPWDDSAQTVESVITAVEKLARDHTCLDASWATACKALGLPDGVPVKAVVQRIKSQRRAADLLAVRLQVAEQNAAGYRARCPVLASDVGPEHTAARVLAYALANGWARKPSGLVRGDFRHIEPDDWFGTLVYSFCNKHAKASGISPLDVLAAIGAMP